MPENEVSLRHRPFHPKQTDFPVNASGVPGERTVCSYDSMAGDDERDGVVPHSAADRPGGHLGNSFLLCYQLCYLSVGHRFAVRNRQQIFPDGLAERGGLHGERWRESRLPATEVDVQPAAGLFKNREQLFFVPVIERGAKILLPIEPEAGERSPITGEGNPAEGRIVMPLKHHIGTLDVRVKVWHFAGFSRTIEEDFVY